MIDLIVEEELSMNKSGLLDGILLTGDFMYTNKSLKSKDSENKEKTLAIIECVIKNI